MGATTRNAGTLPGVMSVFFRIILAFLFSMILVAPDDVQAGSVRHYHRSQHARTHRHWHKRLARHHPAAASPTPVPSSYPQFLGDLFVVVPTAPLWSKPNLGAQALAQLPKRTVVTNMGRVAIRTRRGSTAYFYKVEAPNGKVGFVAARYVSTNPPDW